MPRYIRAQQPGGTFFFTVVTHRRRKLFNEINRMILQKVIIEVQSTHPFNIDAWVLLPEHLHCIWTLPEGEMDFSKRWGLIKAKFSKELKGHRTPPVWQDRFWEHLIRNDQDFQKHLDYIHYNPVKHGLVESPKDWPSSTFHRYLQEGLYPLNWGEGVSFQSTDKFGE